MLAGAVVAYGRQAYAACVNVGGSNFECSGSSSAQILPTTANAHVVTLAAPPFSILTGSSNALSITGTGDLSYTDINNSTITATGGNGINVRSTVTGLPGSITIDTNGDITARNYGIRAENFGTGAVAISLNGDIASTGTTLLSRGIFAINRVGTDLIVSTGVGTSISAARYGIGGRNYGTGSTTVTVSGNVTATGTTGIDLGVLARGNADVIVTTAAGTTVSGQETGISARSDGNGAVRIVVDGDVTGTNTSGIYARSGTGGSIAITVGVASHVTSNGTGFAIDAANLAVSAPTNLTVAGTLNGGAGGAVRFGSAADRLELQPTAAVNGTVFAGAGIDTLALGGTGVASLDVSQIGASATYREFELFEKSGASQWTLTGTSTVIPAWAVNAGLLSVSGSMPNTAFTVNGGILALTGTGNIASVDIPNAAGVFDISAATAGATISTLSGVENSSVVLGGRTLTLSNASGTFSGVLSGTGGLTLIAGTETLAGANSYSGITTINGGTLALSGTGSIANSSGVNVNAAGVFDISATAAGATISTLSGVATSSVVLGGRVLTLSNASGTFDGMIGGMGGLTLIGGTETLAGTNSYSGATTIDGGTLALAGAGSIANSSGVNVNAGMFDISATAAGATISTLSGVAASSVVLGGRVLTLSNASGTFDGVIGGTGGLVLNAGMETLSGVSTYTGSTTVNGGILSAPGSLASPVTVNSAATLIGNGAIGGLTVNSGGIVMPGSPLGRLTVNGNLALNAGALLHADVSSTGQSSGLTVNGNVQLTGASLQLHVKPGDYAPATDFIVIDNRGSNPVQGTFAAVTAADLPFLVPFVSYDAGTGNDVGVRLLRSDVDFCYVAVTANQCSLVRAFQRLPLDDKLLIAVVTQTAEGARQAADAVSGELYPTINGVLVNDSHLVRQVMLGRLRQTSYDGESGAMAALASGGPHLASVDAISGGDAPVLAYAGSGKRVSPTDVMPTAAKLAAPAVRDLTFWAQSIGAWGRFGSDGNAADARHSFGGVMGGFDGRFGNWRAGLVTGYSQSSVNVDDRASSALIDTGYVGFYAGTSAGAWNLRSGAVYALHDIGASRTVAFPGFSDRTSVKYRGDTAQIFGEVGYGLTWGTLAAEPFAGFSWVHVDAWRFTEAGGASALSGANNTVNLGFSSLGMRIATNFALSNGAVLTPRASLAWEHGFGDVVPAAGLAFASSGTAFIVAGVPLARDVARIDVGADLWITPQARIGVFYSGQLSSRVNDHAVRGELTWNF
jgi:outer membrane autotransporter protein